jgi:hypothetical protein
MSFHGSSAVTVPLQFTAVFMLIWLKCTKTKETKKVNPVKILCQYSSLKASIEHLYFQLTGPQQLLATLIYAPGVNCKTFSYHNVCHQLTDDQRLIKADKLINGTTPDLQLLSRTSDVSATVQSLRTQYNPYSLIIDIPLTIYYACMLSEYGIEI